MKPLRILALLIAITAWGTSSAFAGGDCCGAKSATAAKGSCSAKGTSASAASTGSGCPMGAASASAEHCAHGAGKTATAASGSCPHGTMAMAAGTCPGSASAHADCTGHASCAICTDDATWTDELRNSGARSQVVALRNGCMIVYTADSAEGVRALQAMLSRHNQTVMGALAARSDASLCGECKSFRGAMASGKFNREIVNVKNGCQILLTSNDRSIVERIHGMTGAVAVRTKG